MILITRLERDQSRALRTACSGTVKGTLRTIPLAQAKPYLLMGVLTSLGPLCVLLREARLPAENPVEASFNLRPPSALS